jgi:uncharacterized repeat protein (TIGR03803 family)
MSLPTVAGTFAACLAHGRLAWFFLLPLAVAGWGMNHRPPVAVHNGATQGASASLPRRSAGNVSLRPVASQEDVLYSFQQAPDGQQPLSSLLVDKKGVLYGTTVAGGTGGCAGFGCGTVVKLRPSGNGYTETVIYDFQGGSDGAYPRAGLIADTTGALYGTTQNGGNGPCSGGFGCGTAFKLTPSGTGYAESVLYRFHGGSDGANPLAGVIADDRGALYGTTPSGGTYGAGTVFKLTLSGTSYTESVLRSYGEYKTDAATPYGGVILGAKGALYGTSAYGGAGYCSCGTVFKLTRSRSGYRESILHSFTSGSDGAVPYAGLLAGTDGALYGTTTKGGYGSCAGGGCGTVFKLTPSPSGYTEGIIYSFQAKGSKGNGNDGASPFAGLLATSSGMLFGTTIGGGSSSSGTVFKLAPNGSTYVESVVYGFKNGTDGAYPYASLILNDKGDTLYGTTQLGGTNGNGTVFRVK